MRGVPSLAIPLAAIIAATTMLSGCGGGGHANAKAQLADCKTGLLAAAEAKVLSQLYRAGKLGTPRAVRAQSSRAHPFVLANGKMVPYARMTAWQRASFAKWAVSAQVDRVARTELADADRAAAQRAQTRCG